MRLRKYLRAAAAVAALGLFHPVAQAATVSNNVTVSVTLTSVCTAVGAGVTVAFGTYTAFQVAAVTPAAVNLSFTCTRGLVPTGVAFDVVNGTAAGVGVVQGLQYTLTVGAATTVAGTAATTATIGTGDTKTYPITSTMPGGQAGQCATTSCGPTTVVRTLIVTY